MASPIQRLFGQSFNSNGYISADRVVAFDQTKPALRLRPGEEMVIEMADVEDTKAAKGERGRLMVTTFRVIWVSSSTPSINLAIGLANIHKLDYKGSCNTRDVKPVCMLTRFRQSSFEFIFTPQRQPQSEQLLAVLDNLRAAYLSTSYYRELRLRANITVTSRDGQSRELILLQDEEVHERVAGVMNLSQEHGQLGVLWVTNVRVVWAAALQDNFNCSLPYYQLKSARVRPSKFGTVMVLETYPETGKYLLGFQVAPKERLAEVVNKIELLLQMHHASPLSGVHACHISDVKGMSREALDMLNQEKDVTVDNPIPSDALAAYYAHGDAALDEEPVFDRYIGLSIEPMPPDVDMQTLWSVL